MKRAIVLAPLLCAGLAAAQGAAAPAPKFGGFLYDADTAAFVVTMQQDTEHWYFTVPGGVYFWVKLANANDYQLDDVDLSEGPVITLAGAAGDKFKLRIYAVAGEGRWSAEPREKVDSAGRVVAYTDQENPAAEEESWYDQGSLDQGEDYEFEYQTDEDTVYLSFRYPEDARFTVQVTRKSGKVLGDYDLDDGNTVPLFGGGKFKLKVTAREGGGDWKVKPVEQGE